MSKSRIADLVLGVALLGAVAVLSLNVLKTRASLEELSAEMSALNVQKRLASIKADALEEVLQSIPLPSSVPWDDAVPPEEDGGRPDLVIYWMSPECPSCRVNYPELRKLSAQMPNRVIAVSPDGQQAVRADYEAMGIPIINVTRQQAKGLFPGATFPTTLLIRGEQRSAYLVGRFDADSVLSKLRKWKPRNVPVMGAR